jgi:prepilin-type N-terminal cleavage/methylation domain-containing protein
MAKPPAPARSQDGFSLVEVLVSLVILGFIALGIAQMFSHATIVNATGYDYAILATEARRALESLQALPFDDPALNATPTGTTASFPTESPRFAIDYTVEDYKVASWVDISGTASWPAAPSALDANLKKVTLIVRSPSPKPRFGHQEFVASAIKVPG